MEPEEQNLGLDLADISPELDGDEAQDDPEALDTDAEEDEGGEGLDTDQSDGTYLVDARHVRARADAIIQCLCMLYPFIPFSLVKSK